MSAMRRPGQPLPPYTLKIRSGKPVDERGSLVAIVSRTSVAVRDRSLCRKSWLSTPEYEKRPTCFAGPACCWAEECKWRRKSEAISHAVLTAHELIGS